MVVKLSELKPGDVFRRECGTYRYRVSTQTDKTSYGEDMIWCYNLDGESSGYHHPASERVVVIDLHRPEVPTVFWMCYVEGQGAPAYRHSLPHLAREEAERLAQKTGRRVFILEADAYVDYVPPQQSVNFFWRNL